ncbi:MAG: outer membrane protein assembly factor BamA [Candidatus Sericytochromatia bacterium]|nr:outer membrane protein assembly factor BamA [Candidatus Sericytochromatia bacterium]
MPIEALENRTISALRFSGEVAGLKISQLREILNISPGTHYSVAMIRRGMASLYQTGRFETIQLRVNQADEHNIELDFRLQRARFVTDWNFSGARALQSTALERLLNLSWGQRFNPSQPTTWKRILLERYTRLGYPDARLSFSQQLVGLDQMRLNFFIDEGPFIPVRGIRLEGVEKNTQKTLLSLLEMKAGCALSRDAILAGIRRLEAHLASTGMVGSRVRWQATLPDGTTDNQHAKIMARRPAWIDLIIRVDPGRKALVEVEGDTLLAERELAKAITVYERQSVSPFEIETSVNRIKDLYAGAGFPHAEVKATLESDKDEYKVRFHIAAGARVRVHHIEFLGNASFTTRKLESVLQTRGAQTFRGGTSFDPLAWEEDLSQLREWYVRNGFLKAKITEGPRRSAEGRSDVDLQIRIEEGPQTSIGRIQFPGISAYQQAGALQSVPINPGDPYNPAALSEWIASVQAYMARLGYPLAKVTVEIEGIHSTDALLRFNVTRGPRKTVGRILLRGNLKTQDEVIRRQITVHTGDFYDAEELFRTQQQIYQLGFFDRVSVEPARPLTSDPNDPIDLVVIVHERETGWIGLGGGYGSLQGAQLSAEFLQNNLAGSGKPLRVEGLFSIPRATLSGSIRDPALFGSDNIGELGFTFLSERRREGEPLYQTYGPTIGLSKPFGETWISSLRYSWGRTTYPGLTAEQVESAAQLPDRVNSIFTAGVTHDSRSDVLNPRWGSKVDLNVDYSSALLGGNLVYVRPRITGARYLPLPRRIVLALGLEAGWVQTLNAKQSLPTDLLFVTGGASSLRGYFNNVFPAGQPEGGRLMVVSHAEVRIPVLNDLGAVVFVDGGNVWGSAAGILQEGVRLTSGGGLRYHTPVGPLRVDYGVRIWPFLEWPAWEGLYVGLGHAF